MKYRIEVCANSVVSCVEAQKGGAYRVELCAGIPEGGTTPSYGEIVVARELLDIKLNIIVRPRGGDFLYSDIEHQIMLKDIEIAKTLGVDGVVFGCLTADGEIDMERNKELVDAAQGMNITFHRAFDMCKDPFKSLEQIIELGFAEAELLVELNTEHEDSSVSILAFGSRVQPALEAAHQLASKLDIAVRVVNMRFVKPLDEQIIRDLADKTNLFVTVEEHAVMAGAGSAVNEFMAQAQIIKPILNLGFSGINSITILSSCCFTAIRSTPFGNFISFIFSIMLIIKMVNHLSCSLKA